jgi:hypothetical protein
MNGLGIEKRNLLRNSYPRTEEQIDKQPHRQTVEPTSKFFTRRKMKRYTNSGTDGQIEKQLYRQTDIRTNRQIDIKTDRHKDR